MVTGVTNLFSYLRNLGKVKRHNNRICISIVRIVGLAGPLPRHRTDLVTGHSTTVLEKVSGHILWAVFGNWSGKMYGNPVQIG